MDPFDDILLAAPAPRARLGGKFAPKVKSKQPPRKEISEDQKNVNVASSLSSKDPEGISQNEFHNAVAVSTSTKESMRSGHCPQVELQNLEDARSSKIESSQQVSVNQDTEALVDDPSFTNAESEVVADQNFTKFPKPSSEVDSVGHAIKSIFGTDLNNGTTQPVHPVNTVENELNNGAAPRATCPTICRVEEPHSNGEGSLIDIKKSLEVTDNSLQISPNVGFKSTSDENNPAITETNIHSNFDLGKEQKIMSEEFELDPFSGVLIDPCNRNARKFQPKVKLRPKPGRTPASTSSSVFMEKSVELPPCTNEVQPCHSSGDVSGGLNQSFGLPLPTSEILGTANIFSGLDLLDDFLPQAATGTVCDTTQAQRCPEYHTTQDSLTFNNAGVVNDDASHTNNSTDPTSEIPMHEDLINFTDSPTLADSLHQDVTGEKEDANENNNSLRKRRRSSITGDDYKGSKTSRQGKGKKQAACKPAHNSLSEDVGDDDDLDPPYVPNRGGLEESGEKYEVDNSSKKKKASKNSKKKSEAKDGKVSRKRKKANDDLEKTTKEPPKKFKRSTRRNKKLDETLLEDYEFHPQSLSLRDIISVADYKERLKKKAATSRAPSTIQSDGDFLHEDGAFNEEEIYGSKNGAFNEEEIYGSEDGRNPDDDQASERITSTPALINYRSFLDKAPRGRWSKQDTEQFYKALRQFGTDFMMIQHFLDKVLPDKKTLHQVKLKYKKEGRQHPLQISDALKSCAPDYSQYKLLIEDLEKESTNAKPDPSRDASDFMQGEEVEDLTPGTNEEEEVATAKQEEVAASKQDDANVKDQEDSVPFDSPEQSDDSDNDLERWSQYKSAL